MDYIAIILVSLAAIFAIGFILVTIDFMKEGMVYGCLTVLTLIINPKNWAILISLILSKLLPKRKA